MDALCTQYDKAFDLQARINIVREIDGIVFNQHHYVLTWYAPSERLLYWNKFGQPDWFITRTGDSVLYSWWVDAEKERQVEAGRADPKITMPKGETEVRFWEAYKRQVEQAAASF